MAQKGNLEQGSRIPDSHWNPITSPIISLIVGSEEKALKASRHLLMSGFHVTAIRPPTVPPNSCRLRVTLTAVHTAEDIKKLRVASTLKILAQMYMLSSRIPNP